jgi:hypothetical protein
MAVMTALYRSTHISVIPNNLNPQVLPLLTTLRVSGLIAWVVLLTPTRSLAHIHACIPSEPSTHHHTAQEYTSYPCP